MAGKGQASASFQGKELFTVQVDGAGKVSDSIARLRAEFMTKLNAYMASNAINANGEDPNLLEEAVSDEDAEAPRKQKGKKRRRDQKL